MAGRTSLVRTIAACLAGGCVVGCSFDMTGLAADPTLETGVAPFDAPTADSGGIDAIEPDFGADEGPAADSSVEPDGSVDVADTDLACDATREIPFGGHCYFVDVMPRSFLDARKACEGAGAGTHLVTIDTYDEDTFVGSITIGLEAWMGLTRDPPSNPKLRSSFKWITGEPMLVDAWRGTEPDGTGECARHTGTGWDDSGCAESFAAICERE